MYYSPLRYPGGKSKLASFISKVCIDNNIKSTYLEPYAGGASVGLHLLLNGIVNDICINDADKSLYSFWFSLVNHSEELLRLIHDSPINMETWRACKEIQNQKDNANILDLAFSTFFLNRTNRSGIIKAGVIGGNDQTGNYKMDSRFNKAALIDRIEHIVCESNRITVTNNDAIDFINLQRNLGVRDDVIAYFDPPYYFKAKSLYMNHYNPEDHKLVAESILAINEFKYIISYDDTEEIKQLYSRLPSKSYSFTHNIINSRKGEEILFFEPSLKIESLLEKNPVKYRHRKNTPKKIFYKE